VSTVIHNSSALRLLIGADQESFDIVLADQTRLRGLLDAIFMFVGLFSLDGVVVDVNRTPLHVGKLRREEIVGQRFIDLPWFAHSIAERARMANALERAARGEKLRFETTILRGDGQIRYIDAAFSPLLDSNGAVTHIVGIGLDHTARKHAQEALARSEARLAEAQRVAHVGSWEWQVATNVVIWSDELYRIYAVTREEWDGSYEGFLARVHPDDLDHTRAVVTHALQNVTPFIYDHRIIRPDGRIRMLHTRGDVVTDGQGKAERLVGCCWDVTDRWIATRQLENTVSLLRSTLEATADGILLVDTRGEVRALNQRLRALWRLSDEVTEGMKLTRLLDMVQDQLDDPVCFLEKTSELYADEQLERLDVLRFKDGRVFERYSRPQWQASRIAGRVCSFRDITHREQAQEQLRTSADQLRALAARLDAIREEERRNMAREIHDQIGQALTAMKLDLASLRANLPAGTDRPAVERRVAEMDRLLEQTLETTRRLSAELRPAMLEDLGLAAAIDWQARELHARTGIRCTVQLDDRLDGAGHASETADLGRLVDPATALVLFRIVQEALTNVVRHAGAQNVAIRLAAEPEALVLTIRDDGRGITVEEQRRPSALGLLGMRERALVLGGEVTIEGVPGAGTTVTVRLPREGGRHARPDR
jgi:PAS domain S-box-containing protein